MTQMVLGSRFSCNVPSPVGKTCWLDTRTLLGYKCQSIVDFCRLSEQRERSHVGRSFLAVVIGGYETCFDFQLSVYLSR